MTQKKTGYDCRHIASILGVPRHGLNFILGAGHSQAALSTLDAHKGASGYSRQPLCKLDSRSCSAFAVALLIREYTA
jgi:hypothetical protein